MGSRRIRSHATIFATPLPLSGSAIQCARSLPPHRGHVSVVMPSLGGTGVGTWMSLRQCGQGADWERGIMVAWLG